MFYGVVGGGWGDGVCLVMTPDLKEVFRIFVSHLVKFTLLSFSSLILSDNSRDCRMDCFLLSSHNDHHHAVLLTRLILALFAFRSLLASCFVWLKLKGTAFTVSQASQPAALAVKHQYCLSTD